MAIGHEGDGFVVEPDDLPAALTVLMVKEAHGIADARLLPAQATDRILPDAHVGAVEIDPEALTYDCLLSIRM